MGHTHLRSAEVFPDIRSSELKVALEVLEVLIAPVIDVRIKNKKRYTLQDIRGQYKPQTTNIYHHSPIVTHFGANKKLRSVL